MCVHSWLYTIGIAFTWLVFECVAAENAPARFEMLAKPGPKTFITALAADADGVLWLASEEAGLFRVGSDGAATVHTAKNGFADDLIYALCFDRRNRLWAGTLKHGVTVRNGGKWQNYGSGTGPLGERVYAVACNPIDGDVWIGTNAGLARYSVRNDLWTHITPANGLPSWDIVSLAFDVNGYLYIGTASDGLAIATAKEDYKRWHSTTAIKTGTWLARGSGLPSDQINQVMVTRKGVGYAATTAGLAYSTDRGRSWGFVRGGDYVAKAKGLAAGKPSGLQPPKDGNETLPEDYVTCVAEDSAGGLWLGFRRKGLALVDPISLQVEARFTKEKNGLPDDYVQCLLPMNDGRLVVGSYGGGAGILNYAFDPKRQRTVKAAQERGHPARTKGPSSSSNDTALGRTLARTLKRQQTARRSKDGVPEKQVTPGTAETKAEEKPKQVAFPTPKQTTSPERAWGLRWAVEQAAKARKADVPFAIALDDDWQTRGDWIGTYGRFYHCLCGVKAPLDWIGGEEAYWVRMRRKIGEHTRMFPLRLDEFPPALQPPKEMAGKRIPDTIRSWIHFKKSDYPWALQLPKEMGGGRRQAEWDDHAECYPYSWEGPHLYCDLMIGGKKDDPQDLFLLSFYIVNKDGHLGNNRYRDYLLTIKAADETPLLKNQAHPDWVAKWQQPGWEAKWCAAPTLAQKRIADFRGGVYKRFLVRRGKYTLRVDKNNSFNTILSGIFIDRVRVSADGLDLAEKGTLSPDEIARHRKRLLGKE